MLNSWEARNLFGYKLVSMDLSAEGKVVLVDGVNHDFSSHSSNGAGKSSLFEVPVWVLFDQTIRGVDAKHGKDAVIRTIGGSSTAKAKRGAWGKVIATLPSGSFVVERFRRDKKRRNEVEVYLDGKRVTQRDRIQINDQIVDMLGFDYSLFKRGVVFHSRVSESFSSVKDRYIKLICERLIGVPPMEGLQKLVAGKVREYSDAIVLLNDRVASLEDRIASLDEDISSMRKKQKEFSAAVETERTRLVVDMNSLILERVKIAELLEKKKLALASSSVLAFDCDSAEYLRSQKKVISRIAVLVSRISELRKVESRLVELKGVCSLCLQHIDKMHVKAERTSISIQLSSCEALLVKLKKKKLKLDKAIKRESGLREQAEKAITSLQYEIAELKSDIVNMDRKISDMDKDIAKTREDPYEDLILSSVVKKKALSRKLEEGKHQSRKRTNRRRYYEFWRYGFSPEGIRSYLLDAVTPELNRLSNVYLDSLTDGSVSVSLATVSKKKDGSFRDKFSIEVSNSIGSADFAGDSDGEIACVDLSIGFAVSNILESKVPTGIGVMFIDQAIDLVDTPRGEKALSILRDMTNPKWCESVGVKPKTNIFCITHRPELKDMFDDVIMVEKRNGVCSRIQ